LCGFVSATVWAGVNAAHCPITCPNRQLPPERYMPCAKYVLKIIEFYGIMETSMEDVELKHIVESCVDLLMKNEGEIIRNDINERTITHKLAEYLQKYFQPPISVDVEYNRNIELGKRKPKHYQDKIGMPDIIIHKRLHNDNNLLIIEIKKHNNNNKADREKDFEKLEAFTTSENAEGYNFQLGLFLDIPIDDGEYIYTWYKNGLPEIAIQER
jgi:hypothetical protein